MRYLSALLVVVLIVGCSGVTHKERTRVPGSIELKQIHQSFQSLVEEALVWRSKAIEFYNEIEDEERFSNTMIVRMHKEGTLKYKSIRDRLFKNIERYKWITDDSVTVSLTTDPSSYKARQRFFGLISGKIDVKVNPKDDQGRRYIVGFKTAVAAATILYDNYILAIGQYEKIKKLRRLINSDNEDQTNFLREISRSFYKSDNFKRTSKGLVMVERELKWERDNNDRLSEMNEYLNTIIKGSYTYKNIKEISKLDLIRGRISRIRRGIRDIVTRATDESMDSISGIFGNSVGLIQWRHGLMWELPKAERVQITKEMKPLDLIFEKTPFRLTDKFIPGHWGHVAVWTGNEEELKEMGIWKELPALYEYAKKHRGYKGDSFQKAVQSGHFIIEALRPGVQINTLDHFLEIDDYAVIRVKNLSKEKRKEYLIHAFRQIGKDYDFNFDVETDKKIVCSELAYVVYGDASWNWPTENTLNRATISPDNVASKAMQTNAYGEILSPEFDPVMLYHKGKRCSQNNIKNDFDNLMKQNYDMVKCGE